MKTITRKQLNKILLELMRNNSSNGYDRDEYFMALIRVRQQVDKFLKKETI
jgi:hypothetical protein